MKPRLKSSPAARDLIKRFEPFRETAQRGADGRWVVGYGHRAAARAGIKVSEEEAALLLIYDVMRAEEAIDDLTSAPLARGQRDALISFVHDVGVAAFRNSDVARYLFEGRMDAAGDALAAHGDGTSPRREAEARMFQESQLPVTARAQPVELVIKVEHPSEERVLEGAIAGGSASREPVEDYAPPPPPMPDRAITSRREAEAEIARILATVEAMPLAERETMARDADDAIAPISNLVSDLDDTPVDAVYEAVEDADDVDDAADGAGPVEDRGAEAAVADEAPAREAAAGMVDEAAPEQDGAAGVADTGDSTAARVAARMVQELDESGSSAGEAETDAEPAMLADTGAEMPEDAIEPGDGAKDASGGVDAPVDAVDGADVEPRPQAALSETLMADFDLSSGMDLGFVLTRSAAPGPEAEPQPAPQPASYSLDLPEGSTLGYAFTSVMTGRFQPRDETSAPVAGEPDIDADGEAVADAPTEAAAGAQEAQAVTEIVERAVAVAGDETPPPHPAEIPAESAGAVGEVEAGARADDTAGSAIDALTDDPLMGDDDDMLAGDDEFSPQDLAADVEPEPEKPVRKGDDGGWGFLASFTAGAVVSGFGLITTWGEWSRMWAERTLSGDAWVLIAGVFLMLVSAWFLGSVWMERLKGNGRDTAKVR